MLGWATVPALVNSGLPNDKFILKRLPSGGKKRTSNAIFRACRGNKNNDFICFTT
jgi:hypothetical protein